MGSGFPFDKSGINEKVYAMKLPIVPNFETCKFKARTTSVSYFRDERNQMYAQF